MANTLGQFEQLVLLSILQLDADAFGVQIRDELESRTGRKVSRGALYTTLDRLEAKGILEWEMTDSTPERGGLARRRFKVMPSGIEELKRSRELLMGLWSGLEEVLS